MAKVSRIKRNAMAAALGVRPERAVAELWRHRRPKPYGGQGLTLAEIAALLTDAGEPTGTATLSDFYAETPDPAAAPPAA